MRFNQTINHQKKYVKVPKANWNLQLCILNKQKLKVEESVCVQ